MKKLKVLLLAELVEKSLIRDGWETPVDLSINDGPFWFWWLE